MFSMCSELTPRAHVPDNRIPQLMQPWRFYQMMNLNRIFISQEDFFHAAFSPANSAVILLNEWCIKAITPLISLIHYIWLIQNYIQKFCWTWHLSATVKVTGRTVTTIYRVLFLTVPPNFQYQNEKWWAANQRFCSKKFSMYKWS